MITVIAVIKIMKKGFTLIELLIVIAILAILATTVVLVLNPAQILAQARDAQRISDLSSVKSAIALYLATATTPAMTAGQWCNVTGCTCAANAPFVGATACVVNTTTGVTNAGWVNGINLEDTSGGSTLASLPLDPSNTTTYFYAYKGTVITTGTFKLAGRLESIKYAPKMLNINDGGISDTYYEIGTNLAL